MAELPINNLDKWSVARAKINDSYSELLTTVEWYEPHIESWIWWIWETNTWIKAEWDSVSMKVEDWYIRYKSESASWTQIIALSELKWPKWDTWPQWATGATWNDWASITHATFSGNDIVFTRSDSENVTLADAKTELKWPKGDKWDTWATGSTWAAATVSVWTTTTWDAGTSASVTNSGTSSAAVLNFTIPKWNKWDTWEKWADWQDWADWNWITSVTSSKVWKTTTVTMNFDEWDPFSFQVQDWADWQGSGDMLTSVYDPNNKAADAFDYTNFINTPTIPENVSDLNNDSWFITGIDSSDVTTALGYTPVDSASLWTAATKNTWSSSWNVPVLDSNWKLNTSVVPAVAITDTFTVNSSSDLTWLTTAEKWDIAICPSEWKTYILYDDPYSTAANWKTLPTPTDAVSSVNSKTWVVTLDADDIDDTNTTNKFVTASDLTNLWNLSGTNTWDQTATDFDIKDLTDSTNLRTTWSNKQDALVNQTNIKSINGTSLLWSWDITTPNTTYIASDFDIKDLADSTNLRSTWSWKQDALSSQTAYTSKWTSTKVPTITTNTLWQVTAITETNISFPVTSVNWQTWAVSWLASMSTITVIINANTWSNKEVTVLAWWVTSSNTVIVSPAPSSINDYASNSVYCSAQGTGTLTFKCNTVPDSAISVNVLILS